MTLKEFLAACRYNSVFITVLTLIGLLAGAAYALFIPPSYTAKATAYVQVNIDDFTPADPSTNVAGIYYSASQLALQKTAAFTPLFSSKIVARDIKKRLGISTPAAELARQISASSEQSSLAIDVLAKADSPSLSQEIADTAVEVTAKKIRKLEGEHSPVRLLLMTSAKLAEPTKHPGLTKSLAAGFGCGLFLAVFIVITQRVLNHRIRGVEELQSKGDLRVLAVIPKHSAIARSGSKDSTQNDYEYIRKLRTSISYARVDKPARIILITSSKAGEGKSSVAQALARVTAQAGKDVLLLDTDLRKPTVADTFGITPGIGLTQVLYGAAPLERAIYKTETPGLFVIPAGDETPYPSEALSSKRMVDILTDLAEKFVVIIDSPPLLPVTDAQILARLADLTLLVVSAGVTSGAQVDQSLELIRESGGHCAGFVLNRAGKADNSYTGYRRYYGYGYHKKSSKRKHQEG